MNICTMTMNKNPKEEDQVAVAQERSPRKKAFSTTKFNSFKMLAEQEGSGFKNPLNVKKSASIGNIKKILRPSPVPIKIDFPDVYTEINKIMALSFGLVVES